jgi:hypothetical protein
MTMPLCHRLLVAAIGVNVRRLTWRRTQPESGTKSPPRPRPPGDEPVRSAGAGEPVQDWPSRLGLADARLGGRQVVKESHAGNCRPAACWQAIG